MSADRVKLASACTPASHEALKSDAAAWKAGTYSIASEPVMGLEWVNCTACNSTLAREVDE